jgi:hypothetical protein
MWCAFVDLCPEGTEIKNSLTVPVNFESNAYIQKHADLGEKKKPYWKYDPSEKRWIKTQGFRDFLRTDLKYTEKQLEDLS